MEKTIYLVVNSLDLLDSVHDTFKGAKEYSLNKLGILGRKATITKLTYNTKYGSILHDTIWKASRHDDTLKLSIYTRNKGNLTTSPFFVKNPEEYIKIISNQLGYNPFV